ncbi:hypothetical protein QQ020_31585 [Fulvivirgaceae bacterium BMA12]|uniref:Uncharacterized protein n=1 Tax=Agaribacillus aureus TaxID=3051825 RepID=A0ABT8LFT6_9BACT|nr:hypothetical protein [Fulvivirgaceae bacterium BMA12]
MVFSGHLKFWFILLGIVMCYTISQAHAFYVSVYAVNFSPDRQELNVTCKVFTNDLEDAVKKKNAITALSIDAGSSRNTKKMVSDYVLERTKIILNDTPAEMIFSHLSWEGAGITETTLCHFKITGVTHIETIEIYSKLLTELYDDQVNIVNVRVGDKRKALNLDKRVHQGKLVF